MRQINSQIESPDPLQGPFSVSGTGRRQCFFWTWFQNCLLFRVYGPRPSALYSNKRPLLTRIFWFLPSKRHRKRFVFARTCSPNIFIEKLFSALPVAWIGIADVWHLEGAFRCWGILNWSQIELRGHHGTQKVPWAGIEFAGKRWNERIDMGAGQGKGPMQDMEGDFRKKVPRIPATEERHPVCLCIEPVHRIAPVSVMIVIKCLSISPIRQKSSPGRSFLSFLCFGIRACAFRSKLFPSRTMKLHRIHHPIFIHRQSGRSKKRWWPVFCSEIFYHLPAYNRLWGSSGEQCMVYFANTTFFLCLRTSGLNLTNLSYSS